MVPFKKTLAAVALATASMLAAASGALAGTISLNHGCYVSSSIAAGATIQVTGSGFTPGEAVFAQIPAPDGLLSFVEVTVGPEGAFVATLTHVLPVSIDPVAENEKMQIKGVLSEQILAEEPFQLTNLAVKLSPPAAAPKKKVTYMFSGFAAGAIVYGHYLHKGRVTATRKFGKATGACGLLKTKAPIYPGKSRYSKYAVQFDNAKKYKRNASPKIDTSLTIFHF
jgi:hypothetical protein